MSACHLLQPYWSASFATDNKAGVIQLALLHRGVQLKIKHVPQPRVTDVVHLPELRVCGQTLQTGS